MSQVQQLAFNLLIRASILIELRPPTVHHARCVFRRDIMADVLRETSYIALTWGNGLRASSVLRWMIRALSFACAALSWTPTWRAARSTMTGWST
jgi:hypothetical protein